MIKYMVFLQKVSFCNFTRNNLWLFSACRLKKIVITVASYILSIKDNKKFYFSQLFLFLFLNNSIFTQERYITSDYNSKSNNSITDIPIYTLDNERFTLYEEMAKLEDDKFLLLNFTSSFCTPCKSEIPELIKLKESYKNLILWFIFVGDDNLNIQKKISELNMTGDFKILKDPLKTSLKRLGVSAVPMTYLIMKDKKIVAYSLGYTQEKFKKFKNQISEVVK